MDKVSLKIQWPDVWHQPYPYPTMTGGTPFAQRFNKLMQEAWIDTHTYPDPETIILYLLIEQYNSLSTPNK